MKVILGGGTGFLGRALSAALQRAGDEVVVLSRHANAAPPAPGVRVVAWLPNGGTGDWSREVDGADAVVNLAGAGIADRRWTPARKQLIRASRIDATASLVAAIRAASRPPRVLLSGSGVDYYPSDDEATFDESSGPGDGFCLASASNGRPKR